MPTGQTSTSSNKTQLHRRTWIFQANPQKYRIFDSLQSVQEEWWTLNQFTREVHVGDRVLIWVSGKNAGIYAIGTVVEEPIVRPDSVEELIRWVDRAEGLQEKPRVLVH